MSLSAMPPPPIALLGPHQIRSLLAKQPQAGLSYTYIVLRTTGDMNLIHHFASGNGANYKCELFKSAPKF